MPALDQKVIDDLTTRLQRFLKDTGGFDEATYLDAGGSAAVYRVSRSGIFRAVKVFDPALFSGPAAAASRRRLEIQKRLVNHDCPSLIQTFRADEAEGTAFIEMEFNEWPQLAKVLKHVPDESVSHIILQLVAAAKFLESQGIVHRDIKPENIHISPDFSHLKLLDLGVAREFDNPEENDAGITDDAVRRPFLATAQYSSPEYLFRLDPPTTKLWKALNFYQVGAVLHDLIRKEALFQHEVTLANRWLVARAVLTKQPSFSDSQPQRLARAKALALRCLTKDVEARLALVSWEDFSFEEALDPKAALRGRLSKAAPTATSQLGAANAARLAFDRSEFLRRIRERIRTELIDVCGTQMPVIARTPQQGAPAEFIFILTANKEVSIECAVAFEWLADIYERTANVLVGARLILVSQAEIDIPIARQLTCTATIQQGEDEASEAISARLAELIGKGLDHTEAVEGNNETLHGLNLNPGANNE